MSCFILVSGANAWLVMARRALGDAGLEIVQALRGVLPPDGSPLVVACSGGADSMALACAAAHLSQRGSITSAVRAIVIDHGLQAGSDEVTAQVAERLRRIGLPAETGRVQVDRESPDGMEAAARQARYTALAELAGPDAIVLLGHTLDDQAETVLLGLARGSGTRSLSGMPIAFGIGPRFVRPLLNLRRAATAQACREWGIDVWSDPHNDDLRFARVRVRLSVLPLLEVELGPGVAEALARTAALARQDADALDALAAPLLPASGEGLSAAELRRMPEAIAARVLRGWLIAGGVEQPSYAHLQAVKTLVDDWHGQQGIDLPGGIRAVRESGVLRLKGAARHNYGARQTEPPPEARIY